MDQRAVAISALAGWAALALLALFVTAALGAVIWRAEWPFRLGPGDAAAIRFTLWQSFLSAGLSVLAAIPLARALAYRRFLGRGLLISVLGAPFILPVIVAVFGLLAIWGRSGFISDALAPLGLGPLDIYGLKGVVLAHVFFNLPLATRLLLSGWAAIPGEQFRLAAQLGLTRSERFRILEWPMLKAVTPGAFLLVFVLCMTSFATVLALGGGPRSTSVELAIYSAIRFEFDLGRAAVLSLVQLGLVAIVAIFFVVLGRPDDMGRGLGARIISWDGKGKVTDAVAIAIGAAFLLTPIAAIVLRGLPALPGVLDTRLWEALKFSLSITALATVLSVAGALAIGHLAVRLRATALVELVALSVLVVSPFVLGTGLFIIINPIADPFAWALSVTAFVNAALSLPFALRILVPALKRIEANYGRLAASLGMAGLARFRRLVWPGIRRPMGFAAGLTAAFSMGDLGVIALFAPVDAATLPLLMYRLMGSYQMEAAAAVGLVLVTVSFALFALLDLGGRLGRSL